MSSFVRCAVWDGQMVLAGGESGYLQIWDLINVQEVSRITAHEGEVDQRFKLLISRRCWNSVALLITNKRVSRWETFQLVPGVQLVRRIEIVNGAIVEADWTWARSGSGYYATRPKPPSFFLFPVTIALLTYAQQPNKIKPILKPFPLTSM